MSAQQPPTEDSFQRAWRSRLIALEEAAERVEDACRGTEIDEAAREVGTALNAVYDLHEALFRQFGLRAIRDQDALLEREGGHVVGALALARGSHTHELVMFASRGGFGDLPYGMGPYGGGWVWTPRPSQEGKFALRATWYEEKVKWRMLWQPLHEASWWLGQRFNC